MTESREVKGKSIADQGNVKKVNDHSFKVKSQSGKGAYEVKATPNGMTCTCPDFVYRSAKTVHEITPSANGLFYQILRRPYH